jgi:hypothetical protein
MQIAGIKGNLVSSLKFLKNKSSEEKMENNQSTTNVHMMNNNNNNNIDNHSQIQTKVKVQAASEFEILIANHEMHIRLGAP